MIAGRTLILVNSQLCRPLRIPGLLVALALVTPSGLAARVAGAQDSSELSQARAKFQRAIELKHAKNYSGAVKLFREVGAVKMTPQVRYHIATCEEQLGQLVAALGGYELALATGEDLPPQFLEEVQASIDELRARIPKLLLERGAGAEAASIVLDGVELGAASIGVETPVDPGPHTVEATAPGFEPFRETVAVSEGSTETLTIVLVEETGAASPAASDSEAGGTSQASERSGFGALPYVVGGAGLVVAATGGVFLGLSQSKVGKVKDLCGGGTDCTGISGSNLQDARDLDQDARTFEMVGWVGLGVGVAALATGTTLFFLDRGRRENPESAGWRFVPNASGAQAGCSITGRF